MPRFYVDFSHNGEVIHDTVGQELDSVDEAKREAVKALAEISAEEIPRDGPLTLTATVYDESRKVTFRGKITFDPTGLGSIDPT